MAAMVSDSLTWMSFSRGQTSRCIERRTKDENGFRFFDAMVDAPTTKDREMPSRRAG